MRRKIILVASLLALTALSGCSSKEAEKPAETKAGKPPVAVEVLKVSGESLSRGIDVVGTLEPKYSADVKSEVRGRITALHVTQWVNVRKGQPLAEIDATESRLALEKAKAGLEGARAQEAGAKAQAESARAQAEVAKSQAKAAKAQEETAKAGLLGAEVDADRAEREHNRVRNLLDSGLATKQSFDEAKSALEAARAREKAAKSQIESASSQIASAEAQANAALSQVAAAEAQARAASAQVAALGEDLKQLETQVSKATIVSPIDGTVSERFMNVGDLPGDAVIMRVVDNSVLNLTVSVPSKDIASVKTGQPLTFSTDSLPGESFEGKVMFINPAADPADRSLRVTAEVRNVPQKLRGGLFVKGRIVTGELGNVIMVPRSALATWDVPAKKGELFTVSGQTAKKVAVVTGAPVGEKVEIVSGILPGDRIVVRGGFNLKDGDPVTVAGGAN